MNQTDPPLPVQRIKAPDDVVRIAGPSDGALVGCVTGPLAAGNKCRHRPQPGMLGILERLDVRIRSSRTPGGKNGVMGGKWHEGAFPGKSRR